MRWRSAARNRRTGSGGFSSVHQGFSAADLGGDQEGFHRYLAGDGRGQRARTEVADLHIARSDGGDDVGAVIEFAPVDLRLRGFFISAVGLGDFRRIDGGLVGHGHIGSLGEPAGPGQGQGRQEAERSREFHGTSSSTGDRESACGETK